MNDVKIPPIIGAAIRRITSEPAPVDQDRKSTRLNSSHLVISYAVFCLKKKESYACVSSRPRAQDVSVIPRTNTQYGQGSRRSHRLLRALSGVLLLLSGRSCSAR